MSDLRIRSEAFAEEIWPEQFLPRQARLPDAYDDEDGDFGPFLVAATRALAALFGAEVEVLPGRPPVMLDGGAPPQVAVSLAGLLATVRLGGDPARPFDIAVSGVALTRFARTIADTLDGVAVRVWPRECRLPGFDIDIACGVVTGHAHVPAPPLLPRAAADVQAVQMFDLPMRVRVEIASDLTMVASLMPLRAGTVLPINPVPDMPLIIGEHRIGRATVMALPDGRQQATIVAMGVAPAGGRT